MTKDFNIRVQPRVEFLDDKAVHELHGAAMNLLERTGVVVHHDRVTEMLASSGCRIQGQVSKKGNIVHIPSNLVEKAVNSAPSSVPIFNRKGDKSLELEDNKSYWGTGSDTPFILDPFTDTRRHTCLDDVRKTSLLVDSLDNFDFLMSMAVAHELPQSIADKHHFLTMVNNTVKPIVFTASGKENLEDIYNMACDIVGGEETFKQKPFIIHYTEPIAPLIHPKDSLEKLLFCVEHNIPVIYTSATTAAQNGPATLAGSLALSVARILSGIVIGQLAKKGAKMIVTMHGSSMDPSSGIHTYASPEHVICQAAAKSMAKSYNLPTFGRAGTTDSKLFDQQGAFEAGYEILMQALCGENLIHDVGYIESGLTSSWDSMVICNEFIGAVKRICKGFEISEFTLALDLIDRVGPEGHFMAEPHTAENFRKEFWFPELIDRSNFMVWQEQGKTSLPDRARQKITNILNNHEPEFLDQKLYDSLKNLADVDHKQ